MTYPRYIDADDPSLRKLVDGCTPNNHFRHVATEQRKVIATYEAEHLRLLRERQRAKNQRDVSIVSVDVRRRRARIHIAGGIVTTCR